MDDDAFGWTPIDRLSLWNFHVDWTTPSNSTFGVAGNPNEVIDLGAAGLGFDTEMCGYATSCIPQLGTTVKIDAFSDRLMYRAVYRRWPDHESLTLNHTIDVDGTDHAGVRWYELTRNGGPWAIHQGGTYAPDPLHRWMASAAMDGDGDFAIGYSVSGGTLSPTIRYAGRAAGDPLGTLPWAEAELVSDGGGKAAAATRPLLGADRIAKFVLGYAGKLHWSESDFQLVTINGAPGLLMRHPIAGDGTYSFDIADGRIRAIYVVRNPDKLRGFLERTH